MDKIHAYKVFGIIFLFVIICFPVFAIDFDSVTDFFTGLKEMDTLLQQGKANLVDKNMYYLINGTYLDVEPRLISKQPYFFLLYEKDLTDKPRFISMVKTAQTPLAAYLKSKLSEEALGLIQNYALNTAPSLELIMAVLTDINAALVEDSIYSAANFGRINLSPDLNSLCQKELSNKDEIAFRNRLLLEEALPSLIDKSQVIIELMEAEWLGTRQILSYHGLVLFKGVHAFRLFNRLRIKDISELMIPLNSKLLLVVKPIAVQQQADRKIWLFEGIHIRVLN